MAVKFVGIVKRFVVTYGSDVTVMQDYYLVIMRIGIEAMGNIEQRSTGQFLFQHTRYFLIRTGVYRTQRIIENNYFRHFNQRTGYGGSLFLSSRQRYAPFTDAGYVTIG